MTYSRPLDSFQVSSVDKSVKYKPVGSLWRYKRSSSSSSFTDVDVGGRRTFDKFVEGFIVSFTSIIKTNVLFVL